MKLLAGLLALALCAAAQQPPDSAKTALVDELLQITHADRQSDEILNQVRNMIGPNLERSLKANLPAGTDVSIYKPDIQAFEDRIIGIIRESLNYQKLKPEYEKLYSDTFTVDELKASVAFYKTPEGKAMVEKLPTLLAKSMQLGQRAMMGSMPQVQQASAQFIQSMKAKSEAQKPKQ